MNDLTVRHSLAASPDKAGFPITAAQSDSQHAGPLSRSFAEILGKQENQMQDEAEIEFAADSSLSDASEDDLPDASADLMVELESTESADDQMQPRDQPATLPGSRIWPNSASIGEQNALRKEDGHASGKPDSFGSDRLDQAGNPSINMITANDGGFGDSMNGHTPGEGVRSESTTPQPDGTIEVSSNTGPLEIETVPFSPRMTELAIPLEADKAIVPETPPVLRVNPAVSGADPKVETLSPAPAADQTKVPGGHTSRDPANPSAQPVLKPQVMLGPDGFQSDNSAAIAGLPSAQAVIQTVEPQFPMPTIDGQTMTGPPIGSQMNAINSVSPTLILGRTSEQPVLSAASVASGLVPAEVETETSVKTAKPEQSSPLAFGSASHGRNPSSGSEAVRSSQIVAASSVTASRRMMPNESAFDRISTDAMPVADVRFTSETLVTRAAPDFSSGRSELPRHIAAQLAEVAQRGGLNRPIEITLNPVELGKVRMTLHPNETGIQVHISTERPETLDLMRRHADVLANEFFGIGFGASEFAFSQGQSDDQGWEHSDKPHEMADSDTLVFGKPKSDLARPIPIIMDRVDIRV